VTFIPDGDMDAPRPLKGRRQHRGMLTEAAPIDSGIGCGISLLDAGSLNVIGVRNAESDNCHAGNLLCDGVVAHGIETDPWSSRRSASWTTN
jgi:hypothetical protein